MSVNIKGRKIGSGYPCYVIAEIGINHNGSLSNALELITVAHEAGAEAVKFQKRDVPTVYTPQELAAPRTFDSSIIQNALDRISRDSRLRSAFPVESIERLKSGEQLTNGDLKYSLEFGALEYDAINRHCLGLGMTWSASPWDGLSANFINGYEDVHWLKVASACITHTDLLRRIRAKNKPVIASVGGCTLEEVQRAVDILGCEDLILMHCVALYPPSDEDTNLQVMKTLGNLYPNVPIGFSSHSYDILAPVTSVGMGATVVEAHLTLDQNLPGSDHKSSLNPSQFAEMVKQIRRVEKMRGDGVKRVLTGEVAVMKKLRRVNDLFPQTPTVG